MDNFKIISISQKHNNGRCYAYKIRTNKGTYRIKHEILSSALNGIILNGMKIIPSRSHEGADLIFTHEWYNIKNKEQ